MIKGAGKLLADENMQQEEKAFFGHKVYFTKRIKEKNWRKDAIPVVLQKRVQMNRGITAKKLCPLALRRDREEKSAHSAQF